MIFGTSAPQYYAHTALFADFIYSNYGEPGQVSNQGIVSADEVSKPLEDTPIRPHSASNKSVYGWITGLDEHVRPVTKDPEVSTEFTHSSILKSVPGESHNCNHSSTGVPPLGPKASKTNP